MRWDYYTEQAQCFNMISGNLSENTFKSKTVVYLTLLLPALLLYFKSLFFQFTSLDEQWMIVSNAPFLNSSESLKQAFTTPLAGLYYRPFLLLTIIFDFKIGGLDPFLFHLSNLLLHLFSVFLLFRFLIAFGTERIAALLLSVLFSVHPIHLHAVAWVPGRNDTLLFIFSIGSLLFLKRYLDQRKPFQIILHFLTFLFALSTKETAMMLPVLFLCVYFLYNKGSKFSALFSLSWLSMSIAWYILRWKIVDNAIPSGESFFQSLILTIQGLTLYLGKICLTTQLSVFPTIKNTSLWPGVLSVLVLSIFTLFPGVKNKKEAVTGLFLFLVMMSLPVWFNAVHTAKEQYEHRAYLPMAGIVLFLSHLKFNYRSNRSLVLISILFLLLSSKTFSRMEVYRNKNAFLQTAVKESPDHYFFQMQMAEMLSTQGNYSLAIDYYTRSISIRSNKYEVYNNRGIAFYNLGKFQEAIRDFNIVIDKSVFNPAYYLNRCNTYASMEKNNEALNDLLVLLDCCANDVPQDLTKNVIDKWLLKEGSKLDSVQNRIPGNAALYFKRGQILIGIGNTKKGLEDLKSAAELAPDSTRFLKYFLKKQTEFGN